jgi:neural Wiskott-Aldrich syndrome protein
MIADGLSRIAMSSGLAASLSRATDYARAQGHGEVTLEHMLLALCDDSDAALVLAASNVNVGELIGEVNAQLAAMPTRTQAPDGDLVVASDMRRILEAAAAAARGGRRREINGAIVLAAIVGDGKSAAAQVLSALGLTFEGAIRALQSKPAESEQRALPAPDAEAILAGARERVQSRTGVTARRLPLNGENAFDDDAGGADPRALQDESRALPPPAYEAEPSPEPLSSEPDFQHHYDAPSGYEGDPAYEQQQESPFEAAPASEPDQYHEVEPRYEGPEFERQPGYGQSYEQSYEDSGPPPMPASAPFPPPVPVPGAHDSWTPPPTPPPPSNSRFGAPPSPPRGPALPPMPAPSSAGPPRPGPPPLAPWPEAQDLAVPAKPGAPMGYDNGGERFGRVLSGGAAPARAPATASRRSVSPRTEIGQLVENIPRSMRIAVPALIEVRIARADVQALAEGLQGGGAAYQHEVTVTKAMSVRLRAPDGGFFIETASPETQWIEKAMLLSSDDFASWRWHVTPRDRGRRRLQLIISARTVSSDGLAAETALPDQVITVRVHTNYVKAATRWLGWGAAAVIGGLLAKFGEGAFAMIGQLITG